MGRFSKSQNAQVIRVREIKKILTSKSSTPLNMTKQGSQRPKSMNGSHGCSQDK